MTSASLAVFPTEEMAFLNRNSARLDLGLSDIRSGNDFFNFPFKNYIPLVFVKNYSPQVLKSNMRVVGATEYALILYRDKLPKFRNGLRIDENGKNIRGTGRMIFNWFSWERDGNDIPKIHPAQKPVKLMKQRLNKPIDDFNHLMDAMRYALEDFMEKKTAKVINRKELGIY